MGWVLDGVGRKIVERRIALVEAGLSDPESGGIIKFGEEKESWTPRFTEPGRMSLVLFGWSV